MKCKGECARASKHVGPFVIGPAGALTSLDGHRLPSFPRQDTALPEWGVGDPYGSPGRGVHPDRQILGVGMPSPSWRPGPALEGMLQDGPAAADVGMAGSQVVKEVEEPIGVRPSVPPRLGVNVARLSKPASPLAEPFGLQPLHLTQEHVYGGQGAPFEEDALAAPEGELRPIIPTTQYVPPLPAPQAVCLVNGFDPRWGKPPSTYRGVVVQFDPSRGAYRFQGEALRAAFERSGEPRLMGWYQEMRRRYDSGLMLQPYKPADGTGTWAFRWIPRRQEVVC